MARSSLTVGSPGRGLRWGWMALLLSVLAVTADWFALPIFVGHSLVLGVVFYWIALFVIGPNRALLVLLAGTAMLTLKWGQPYSAALVASEGLSVGWAWRRGRNPFLAVLLFWAVIGTPVAWYLYGNVYVIPYPSFVTAIIVQPVNGLIAVWVTFLALEVLAASGYTVPLTPVQSFHRMLFKRYTTFGILPVLIIGLVAARTFEQHVLNEARDNLKAKALNVAAIISRQLEENTATLQELAARQSDQEWFHDAARLSKELAAIHARSGMFVTVLAADSAGMVFAAAPQPMVASSLDPGARLMVTDREYFAVPMRTGRSHVSAVFRGRGFGADVLSALSAPVVARSGERLGVIQGSINTKRR